MIIDIVYTLFIRSIGRGNLFRSGVLSALLFCGSACNHTDKSDYESTPARRHQSDSIVYYNLKIDSLIKWNDRFAADGDKYGMMYAQRELGILYRDKEGDFVKAVEHHKNALSIAEELNDTIEIIRILNNLGTDFRRSGIWEEASAAHYRALKYISNYSDQESPMFIKNKSITYNSLGNIFMGLRNFPVADSLLRIALSLETQMNSDRGKAINYANLGSIFEKRNLYDSALYYFEKTLEANLASRYEVGISLSYNNLGRMAEYRKDYAGALDNYMKAYDLMKKRNDRWNWLEASMSIVRLYVNTGKLTEAKRYLDEAEETVKRINSHRHSEYFYEMKYRYFEKKGDYRLALENYILSAAHADSVKNINNNNLVHSLNLKYETEQRENQITLYKTSLKQKQLTVIMLIAGLLVALMFLLLLSYLFRMRTKRNQALEEMNATKDKFFSIISHDLKNPAFALRDALQLLLTSSASWNTETLSEYYSELLKSADSQVELLYNLLNWAQVQTNRMIYQPELFDLAKTLESEIPLIQKMATNKNILFQVSMPDQALVTGDSNMLSTVIRNLLTNAVKFTESGGKVTFTVERKSAHPDNTHCVISVADTGLGMSRELIESLFRLDSRHSHQGTAGEQGSGLGLIVCRELLEKHGSTLHIESEIGKGSLFWFEL